MVGNTKKLSIAFYWHMHQPVYQLTPDSDYIMPWTRLHAVKDYLDMLTIIKDYKNIKLNFNIVPILIDSFIRYGEKGYHDIHSRISVKPVEELTDEDKNFIIKLKTPKKASFLCLFWKIFEIVFVSKRPVSTARAVQITSRRRRTIFFRFTVIRGSGNSHWK